MIFNGAAAKWIDLKLPGEDVFDRLLQGPKEREVTPVSRTMNSLRHDKPAEPIEYELPPI